MATVTQPAEISLESAPQMLEKLDPVQNQAGQVNTIRPTASKSADNRTNTQLVYPEKSVSLTLAERRKTNNNNIPASLQLYASAADTKVSHLPLFSLLQQRCSMQLNFPSCLVCYSLSASFYAPFRSRHPLY